MREILLVEDDEVQAYLILRALRRAGIRNPTCRVEDGSEALEFLRERTAVIGRTLPDLVLLDLKLPKLPGLDVLRAMRADAALRGVPVVIVTSSDSPSDRESAMREGAQGFVIKPCDAQKLRAALPSEAVEWTRPREGVA